jgi:HK97 family phage major capsid protein
MNEAEMKALREALVQATSDLRMHAEAFNKERTRIGAVTDETKAKADELIAKHSEVTARLQAAEQLIAKLDTVGGSRRVAVSAGRLVTASEALQALRAAGAQPGNTARINVNAAITSSTSSAGDLLVPQYDPAVPMAMRRLRVLDLLTRGRTQAASIIFPRLVTYTNNAAPVSENPASAKPSSNMVWDSTTAPVATIAHLIKCSRQILDDAAMLESEIDNGLRYGLGLEYEEQVLLGSGVGLNLNGLVTQATAYSNPGVNIQAETAIDRLRVALLQVALTNNEADGIVLNPIDWADIELTKNTLNNYVIANPFAMAQPTLWGRPVIDTASMTANSFLVGAFRAGATFYDREDVNVVIATQNNDDFEKNMLTIRCEGRGALAVKRPDAFVTGDFAGVESE